MRLILHIGQPKTGSTSIQNFLKLNKNILLKNGYLYETNTINHQAELDKIFDKEMINHENMKRFKEKLLNIAKEQNANHIIISSESLFNLKKEYIEYLLGAFNLPTRIIVYLKRQDLYLESVWKQWHFKNKHFRDFDDFKNRFKIENYYEVLNRWNTFIKEKDQFLITPFEKRNFPEGLLKHFAKILGLDEKLLNQLNFEIKDSLLFGGNNRGLSPKGLKLAFLCRDLAKGPLDYTIEKFIDKYFRDLFKKDFFESYGLFKNKEDRLNYLRKFQDINSKIAEEFLNKKILFEDEIKEEKKSDELTIADLAKMFMYFGIKVDNELNKLKNNK
jgi:hypothetical protein